MSEQSRVKSEYPFSGRIIRVRVDTIQRESGDPQVREIVEHPGAVAIVPVLPDGRIVLVRQYRPAVGRAMLELPAGTVEPNENVTSTAARELKEETGYRAETMTELTRFYVSPGWCNEELVIYLATGLQAGEQALDDGEEIDTVIVEADEIQRLIASHEIADSKTLVGLSIFLLDTREAGN